MYCEDGAANRALDVMTWRTSRLGGAGPWVEVGGGLLSPTGWAVGGRWIERRIEALGGLAAADGKVAATTAAAVRWWAFDPNEQPGTSVTRFEVQAAPLPWYAPAWADGWLVWVEQAGAGDFDLVAHGPASNDAVRFAGGAGRQHHVAGHGHTLAWVDRGDVIVADTATRTRTRFAASAGFESGPVVDDAFACWEDRGELVRCTDGWSTSGRRPSGDRSRLLVGRDDGWWLMSVAP